MERLLSALGESTQYFKDTAEKVKKSFISGFWNNEKQCLYDVIHGANKDDKVRPNQIFSISLSNPVIAGNASVEGELAKKIINKVWQELYTSYGLRTLSPESPEYVETYIGDQYQRDSAYHQGTVWAWPVGHFITAYLKVNGYTDKSKEAAFRFIKPFMDHLGDACIGSISEIFDGNEPLIPRGCFAQAWSVGEILRAYSEGVLRGN
jgi:glycogen debranching enzyme